VKQNQLFFRQMGYLIVRGVFAEDACGALSNSVKRDYATSFDAPERSARIEEATERFKLAGWLRSKVFVDVASQLLGPNWGILLNRHNHITINCGGSLPSRRPHRDSLQWSRPFLTAVIGLNMPESSQGWPRIVPGSHLWPVGARPNGGGYWLDEDEQYDMSEQHVLVQLGSGDVLFLDPMIFHGAGSGLATEPRIVWTVALRASDELALHQPANELLVHGEHIYAGQDGWVQYHA
jgi:ectoine hydroxylase-related dioxygenase (phytanoyl-CoA dioxygenase family)